MNTFSFLVLYFCIFLSTAGKRQNKITEKEDDNEKLLNLKETCCNSSDFDSFCIPEKCYFFLPINKTWSAARTACRKFYVEFPDLVDLANFSNELEIENFLRINKPEDFLHSETLWIDSTCCENEYDCINVEKIPSSKIVIYGSHNNACFHRSMQIKDGKFQYEKEDNIHYVLCEFRVYSNITTTTNNLTDGTTTEFTDVFNETQTEYILYTSTEYLNNKSEILINTTQSSSETITAVMKTTETTSKISRFCKKRKVKDVTWPDTPIDRNVIEKCPEGTIGEAVWYCNKNGVWEPEEPILDNCLSPWIHEINEEIEKGENLFEIAENLANLSKNDLKWGDVKGLVTTIQSLRNIFGLRIPSEGVLPSSDLLNFSDFLLKTGSNMLNNNQKSSWKSIPEKNRIETASSFMQEMENIGKMISCRLKLNKGESIVKANIALQSFVFRDDSQLIFPRSRDVMNTSTFIRLPKNLPFNEFFKCGQHVSGYGIIYKGISSYLTGDHQKWKINSKTIGFSYANANDSISLPEGSDVEITLEHLQSGHFDTTCVFWNFKTLEWDGTNCTKIKSNATHTKCACSHLTNFAVLMDISGNIGKTDNAIMTYLTYVCCSLSIISLIITIGCLMGFRAVRSRRSTITCNLCYCLLFVNLIVIFGLERTEIPVMCSIVAGILHYVAIASFVWMLLEGYHLYQMVIVVFHKIDTIKFRWLYLCGYGSPLLIVICSVAISPNSYGRKDFCWISYENGFTWSFAGPVAAIILANTVVLMMALRSASNVKMKKYQSRVRNIFGWLKGSFSLMSLLGITWVFGFVYAEKSTLFFAYIFIIFNGLQGVFLMIFHVILNEKVRQCFKNIITRKKVSHHIFINSLRTTTSQNPLNSQMSVQPSKTSYLSSPRRLSVSPVSPASTSHM